MECVHVIFSFYNFPVILKKNCFGKDDKLTSECFFGQVMTSYNMIHYLKGLHVLFVTCYISIVGIGFPNLSSLGTIIPVAPRCVFYAINEIYWMFDSTDMVFASAQIWHHTYTGVNRLTYKSYIFWLDSKRLPIPWNKEYWQKWCKWAEDTGNTQRKITLVRVS